MKEKTNKKINNEWSYKFNETCLSENLWPTYTTIRYDIYSAMYWMIIQTIFYIVHFFVLI